MKKLKYIIWFYLLSIIYTNSSAFAVDAGSAAETSKQNISIISSMFNQEFFLNFIFAIVVLVWTFFVSKVVSAKLTRYLENSASWEWQNREELVWVLSRTAHITILAIGFSITLTILWVDMWIFLWGLWFWIWFTLKIFLSNFIAGIIMVTQWTYHNWDVISVWWEVGKIHRIHSLFTAIQKFDGIMYYVPNVKFLEDNVSNYNNNDKRRVEVEVWVDYDTDIVTAKKIMLQVVEQFPHVLRWPEPMVVVDKLDNSSINLKVLFWIDSKTWNYFMTKSNVTETINLAFRKSGITIPFPQITLSNRDDFTIKQ